MSNIEKSDLINTNSPRDSRVYADGKYVIKAPVATNPVHIKVWLERQKHAKFVVDSIIEKNGNAEYFIPKIIEISEQPFIKEERVSGQPITSEYFAGLSSQQKDIIYNSLAKFISDMNQNLPVLDITSQLYSNDTQDISFFDVLESLKSVLSQKEISIINQSYELLEKYKDQTPSFVFFHGDMNENNIFFDDKTNKVSIIDFTEARYESAYYMFNSDLSRLPWLDLNKIIDIYNKNPKEQPVKTGQNKAVIEIFNGLRTIQRTGNSLMKNSKTANIYLIILKETIRALEKSCQSVNNSMLLANIPTNFR
ncbi:MAG: phosphotransferase [Alphaproteobacteria bacterium]|nr:phosphotransferase [Alphaproteobacteria bacterium]